MAEPVRQRKRARKIVFIRPSRQLKLTLAMLSVSILVTALLMGYVFHKFNLAIGSLQASQPEAAAFLNANLAPSLDVLFVGQGVLWVSSLLVGVLISHRIYGPMVPILRHIHSLARGDASSRVHLRKGDDLKEIADALNELAETLQKGKQD